VIHAAPEAGPVDVYVGDAAVARGVAYGTATGFAAVPNGRQQLRVVPAGAAVDQAIVDMTQGVTAGSATQLMVSGVADDLQATLAGVDLRALPEHQARVRVVNASPDLGAIDVAVAGGSTPFEAIAFRDQSGYVVFDAGPYAFQLWQSGGDAVLLEVPAVPIEPGTVYDVVVFGQSGSGTVQVVVLDAAAGMLTGPSATPIAATPATALLATPAARVTPVAAVGDGTGGVSPSTATPAS
jgi:hypothetical protein